MLKIDHQSTCHLICIIRYNLRPRLSSPFFVAFIPAQPTFSDVQTHNPPPPTHFLPPPALPKLSRIPGQPRRSWRPFSFLFFKKARSVGERNSLEKRLNKNGTLFRFTLLVLFWNVAFSRGQKYTLAKFRDTKTKPRK